MALNPNWPVIMDDWAPFWNCNGGDSPLDRYVEVTSRTRGSNSIQRGRQYELDQVRAGEYTVTLANTDAVLDPANVSGPWYGHILPFQPYRKRAQWPPTVNLLTQVQATGGDLGGQPLGAINTSNSGPSIFTETDPATGQFVASGTAWQGSTVMQFQVPTTATAGQLICWTPQPGVVPGQTYTVQMQVRNATASSSAQVAAAFRTLNASNAVVSTATGSTVTLTGSPTAAWASITVTGTAAATAAMMYIGVQVISPPGATCNVQVDGWQLEKGSSASAWVQPGVWYPMYGGFVERWPSQWDMAGTYGTVNPTVVDAFGLLSQRQLSDPLTMEINNHNPRFLYKLDDPQGSDHASDATGKQPPATLGVSKYGVGSLAFGNSVTATDLVNGVFTGGSSSVATFNNPNPGTNFYAAATFIALTTAGIRGPAGAFASDFTRIVAFRYTGPVPTTGYATVWSSAPKNKGSQSELGIVIANDQKPYIIIYGPSGSGVQLNPPGGTVCDGNWHLITYSFNSAALGMSVGMDGVTGGIATLTSAMLPTDLNSDSLGSYVEVELGNAASWNYKGDIAYAAEFPAVLSGSDLTQIYNAWKSSCAGESTDARYARILRYAGYIGPSSVQTGLTTSMGPANIGGQDAVSALQAVVDTENGEHFVDRSGRVTFRSRSARYNTTTPVYTFGENAAAGEWPYEDAALDYDSTRLGNVVTVTQPSTGQQFTAADTTSITNYFPRTLTRTINSSSAPECQDAANYLLSRYKQPATRVSAITLHPSANPALWPVCLSLELGMRVRIMRRPPAPASPIQVECVVENIQVDMDDQGEAHWTLQCSPADLTPYGIIAAFHTTLSGSPAAGVTSITMNAGADNTNLASQQLAAGQQLVLGQGTANQETVTILSVGATSPGWATATITLTAATTKSHTTGDVICEPLPAGTTDPTTWDASGKFDSIAFAY